MRELGNLALFDFDGTITDRDTFVPFLRYAAGRHRLLRGTLLLGPMYGDTEEDRALLGLATKAFFRGRELRA